MSIGTRSPASLSKLCSSVSLSIEICTLQKRGFNLAERIDIPGKETLPKEDLFDPYRSLYKVEEHREL